MKILTMKNYDHTKIPGYFDHHIMVKKCESTSKR